VGLSCDIVPCGAGQGTQVQGTVTAPNGTDPISQAVIYVPQSGMVPAFSPQVACEACTNPGGTVTAAQVLSNVDGTFTLPSVPSGDSVPIVIQKGRWRKVLHKQVQSCQTLHLSADETRLPGTQAEGDMPHMAVTVGDYDAIECVLRDIGVAGTEFTAPSADGMGGGAVHLYDNGGPGAPGSVNISTLVSDLQLMERYNLIFINCSGTENSATLLQDPQVKQNMVDYVSAGGRLYVTDWSYDWIEQPPPFSPYICFDDDQPCTVLTPHGFNAATDNARPNTPFVASVNSSGTTGNLSQWLGKLPQPIPNGQILIEDLQPSWVQMRQTAIDMTQYPSTTWLTGDFANVGVRPVTVTFDYPPAPQACGKVLFSSYHTRAPLLNSSFPGYCAQGVIDQEHVLEYLVFEISACVGILG
jgi:hypothetical protein